MAAVESQPRTEPALTVRPAATPGEAAARAALARGSVYGGTVDGLREACRPRGHRPGGAVATTGTIGHKSALLAAVLSLLLPGAGQWYCGRAGRGSPFLAGALLSALLGVVLIGFVLLPLVMVWAVVDATACAAARNAETTASLAW